MQKLLHKLVIIFCVICFSFITPCAFSETGIPVVQDSTESDVNLVTEPTKVSDLDIDPINTENVKKSVVPDTQKEIKKVIGLFIKTMVIVAFSAVVLYIVLLFVKKYYGSAFMPSQENDELDALDLSTPDTKQSALKSFLDRTK